MPKVPGLATYIPDARVIDGPRFAPSPIGRALQGAGQEAEDFAHFLEQRDDEDGRLGAARTGLSIDIEASQELNRLQEAGDTGDLANRMREWTKKRYETASKDATGAERKYLSVEQLQSEGRLVDRANSIEATDRRVKRNTAIDDMRRMATGMVYTDPSSYAATRAKIQYQIDHSFLGTEDKARQMAGLEDLAVSAAQGQIDRNPYSFNAKAWVGQIEGSRLASLDNSAQSAIKSREAEARAAAAEARAAAAENANAYMADFGDYAAYRAAGNPPDPKLEAKYSPAAISRLGVKGADGWAKKAADVQAQGDLMLALRSADTREERASIVAKAMETTKSPDNYQFNAGMAETIVATAGKFDAELEKAPGEVAARSGRVKDGFKESGPAGVAAMLGEQERLGVPEPRRVPLPESVATSLTERVASLPPEKQAEEVQAIAGEFGSMWPMVFRQIGGKLPSDAAIMATMPKGRPATLLAEASSLKDGELTAGLPSTAKREVEEALLDDDTMSSLRSSLASEAGGSGTYAAAEASATKLALQYMRRDGLGADEAAQRAAQGVTANNQFAEFNDIAVRVPLDVDVDAVESGMSAIANGFDPSGYDIPESVSGIAPDVAQEQWANAIKAGSDVHWIGAADGSGLYLWDGTALVTKNGQPVVFTWDDLRAAAQ